MMKKDSTDAKEVLKQLGNLSKFLNRLDAGAGMDDCFNEPLEIIQKTMNFDVSVLYKITNVIENRLILKVIKLIDLVKNAGVTNFALNVRKAD